MGVLYSLDPDFSVETALKSSTIEYSAQGNFSIVLPSLEIGRKYYYSLYTVSNGVYKSGEIKTFTTNSLNDIDFDVKLSPTSARFDFLSGISECDSEMEYGIMYSVEAEPLIGNSVKLKGDYSQYSVMAIISLDPEKIYYYRPYCYYKGSYTYGEISSFSLPKSDLSAWIDLSSCGNANCYIVSRPGYYRFGAVKGNSSEEVLVSTAEVLWESFGTDTPPRVGTLIQNVSYNDNKIGFIVPEPFMEGNAVIAARSAKGTILWSWHIWLTDTPDYQVYGKNDAIMMDRNLGATSAVPGDIGALGLLYQGGRKDPFLGPSSIYAGQLAESTIYWPTPKNVTSSYDPVYLAVMRPTTFICSDSWLENWTDEDNLWTTSDVAKSIYDPCPVGWRIPDDGVWRKAKSDSKINIDTRNVGVSIEISHPSATAWYPASGYLSGETGSLRLVGEEGRYWSTACGEFGFYIDRAGTYVTTAPQAGNATGRSVRCMSE